MKIQAIIAAAGCGTRMNSQSPKIRLEIHGRAIISYTIDVFDKCPSVASLILVVPADDISFYSDYVSSLHLGKKIKVVAGGETRFHSVGNGLKASDRDTEVVIIHDAARPLLSASVLSQAINLSKQYPALVVAVEVKSTIKRVYPKTLLVQETLNREELWEIQTPQIFRKSLLEDAYRKYDGLSSPTDDASLIEAMGEKVKVLKGEYSNIKITTKEDLVIAQALISLSPGKEA